MDLLSVFSLENAKVKMLSLTSASCPRRDFYTPTLKKSAAEFYSLLKTVRSRSRFPDPVNEILL
jgi:hypothetical protein